MYSNAKKLVIFILLCLFVISSNVSAATFGMQKLPLKGEISDFRSQNAHGNVHVEITTRQNSIEIKLVFPLPVSFKKLGYDYVQISDLPLYGNPGEPILPYKNLNILIPQGKKVKELHVKSVEKSVLEGKFNIDYGKTPRPISSNVNVVDKPNPEIYGSLDPFPKTLFSQGSVQSLRGYKILPLTVYPVQYIPKKGQLFYVQTMTITLELTDDKISPLFRNLPQDKEMIKSVVDNPEDVETYNKGEIGIRPTSLTDPSNTYNYVVITNNDLNASFQPLVDWKNQKGLNATIVLVEDILNDPDYHCDGLFGDGCGTAKFNDTAAHIRNFIKDAYLNWGTEYVLLGGDDEIIPVRGVYAFVGDTVDRSIPCDMYYGALDGSWDNDNDTIFGEGVFSEGPENGTAGEEADFFAEVYIGRATVDTPEEVTNFVNKVLAYEQNPDADYLSKALMIGEQLDEETEGGNGKDLVTDIIPQYNTKRLYHRDGTFSPSAVMSELNSGTHIVNHDGHANAQYVMGLEISDVDSLTNDKYFMAYSLGCYAAAFDQQSSGDEEAIAEHFILNPTGAFAFIGNSRFGWYIPGMTVGPGEIFDRAFFSVLNSGTTNLGKALQLSKENQYSQNVHRWTYFTLNLLGDPETEIVTDLLTPTAHFQTITDLLTPPTFKGIIAINGTAKKGTAAGATFANFTIDFGAGKSPSTWSSQGIQLTNNGQSEVVDDILAVWNTTSLSSGIYTLRLRVYDSDGRIGEDRWIVRIMPLPAVCTNPRITEIKAGQTFSIDVNITNVEDLTEFSIKVYWNTTLLQYVNHTVTVPKESYPGGILYSPATITKNKLNQTEGSCWVAAKSEAGAYPFSGSGTAFRIFFTAIINGSTALKISSSNLTDSYLRPIPHIRLNGIIEIAPGIHDVAAMNITPISKVVGVGYNALINVTVENHGTFTENFNITLYANDTIIDTITIQVNGNRSKTITFLWNTTDWNKSNYTLSVQLEILQGESNITDNSLSEGWVFLTIPGDVDGDKDVDIYDFVKIASIYGAVKGDENYKPERDINSSGNIEIYDVVICGAHYGQNW